MARSTTRSFAAGLFLFVIAESLLAWPLGAMAQALPAHTQFDRNIAYAPETTTTAKDILGEQPEKGRETSLDKNE